jgi:hypothetical protein
MELLYWHGVSQFEIPVMKGYSKHGATVKLSLLPPSPQRIFEMQWRLTWNIHDPRVSTILRKGAKFYSSCICLAHSKYSINVC